MPEIQKLALHTDDLKLIMIDTRSTGVDFALVTSPPGYIINIELIKECIGELNISAEKDFRSDPLT
jgi:hypothetical protein